MGDRLLARGFSPELILVSPSLRTVQTISAIVAACTMGVIGGFLPAIRAARTPILDALRS